MKKKEFDISKNQRFKQIFEYLKESKIVRNQQDFTERLEADKTTISQILNNKTNLSNIMIDKLTIAFPSINCEWVREGEGEMLNISKNESNVKAIEPFVSDNLVKVRLLEISPTATFTEFAETPVEEYDYTYVYPVEGEEIGEDDVVFSVNGDSMEPNIKNKSRILGKLIKKAQWHWAQGVVIIAFNNSFVIKRILENKLDTDNYLILGSDNPVYPETCKVSLDSINIMYQADRIVYAPIR